MRSTMSRTSPAPHLARHINGTPATAASSPLQSSSAAPKRPSKGRRAHHSRSTDQDEDNEERSDDDDQDRDSHDDDHSTDEDARRPRKRSKVATPRGRSSSRRRSSGRARSLSRSRGRCHDWDEMSVESEDLSHIYNDAPTVVSIQGPTGIRFERVYDETFPESVEELKAIARRKFRLNEAEPVEISYRNPAGAECGLDDLDDLRAFGANAQRASYMLMTVKAAVPSAFASPAPMRHLPSYPTSGPASDTVAATAPDASQASAAAAAAAAAAVATDPAIAAPLATAATLTAAAPASAPAETSSQPSQPAPAPVVVETLETAETAETATPSQTTQTAVSVPSATPTATTVPVSTPVQPRSALKKGRARASILAPGEAIPFSPGQAASAEAPADIPNDVDRTVPPPPSSSSSAPLDLTAFLQLPTVRAAALRSSANVTAVKVSVAEDQPATPSGQPRKRIMAESQPTAEVTKAGEISAPQVEGTTENEDSLDIAGPVPASQPVSTATEAESSSSQTTKKRGPKSKKAAKQAEATAEEVPAPEPMDEDASPSIREPLRTNGSVTAPQGLREEAASSAPAATEASIPTPPDAGKPVDDHASQLTSQNQIESQSQVGSQAKARRKSKKSTNASPDSNEAESGPPAVEGPVRPQITADAGNNVDGESSVTEKRPADKHDETTRPAVSPPPSNAKLPEAPAATPAPKKRGRPTKAEILAREAAAKAAAEAASKDNSTVLSGPQPVRKRGRPSKKAVVSAPEALEDQSEPSRSGNRTAQVAEGLPKKLRRTKQAPASMSEAEADLDPPQTSDLAAREDAMISSSPANPVSVPAGSQASEPAASFESMPLPKVAGRAARTPRKVSARKDVDDPSVCVYCEKAPIHDEADCGLFQQGIDALIARMNVLRYKGSKKTPREKAAVSTMTRRMAEMFKPKDHAAPPVSMQMTTSESVRDLIYSMNSDDSANEPGADATTSPASTPMLTDRTPTPSSLRAPANALSNATNAQSPAKHAPAPVDSLSSKSDSAISEEQRKADELKEKLKQKRASRLSLSKEKNEELSTERAKAAALKAEQRRAAAAAEARAAAAKQKSGLPASQEASQPTSSAADVNPKSAKLATSGQSPASPNRPVQDVEPEARSFSPLNEHASQGGREGRPRPSATAAQNGIRDVSPSSEAELATSPMLQVVSRQGTRLSEPKPAEAADNSCGEPEKRNDINDIEMEEREDDDLPPPNQQQQQQPPRTPATAKEPAKEAIARHRSASVTSSDTSEDSDSEQEDDDDEEEGDDDDETEDELEQQETVDASQVFDGPLSSVDAVPSSNGKHSNGKPNGSGEAERTGSRQRAASSTASSIDIASTSGSESDDDDDGSSSGSDSDSDSDTGSNLDSESGSKDGGSRAKAAPPPVSTSNPAQQRSVPAITPVQKPRSTLSSLNPYSAGKLSSLGRPALSNRPSSVGGKPAFTKLSELRPSDLRRSLSQPNSPKAGPNGTQATSGNGLFRGRIHSNTPDSETNRGGGGAGQRQKQEDASSSDELSSSDSSDSSDSDSSDDGAAGAKKASKNSVVPASRRAGAAVKKPKKDKNFFTCFTK
ncbi:hypothetical protein ACQY0O_002285 [Thecaphora frezii]